MMPLALFIANRYTQSGQKNRFVSFISLASLCGIALGVMVLLTVLSVMNGFQKEIRERMLSLTAPIMLQTTLPLSLDHWKIQFDNLPISISKQKATPWVEGQVMFLAGDRMSGGLLRGVEPSSINGVLPLSQHLQAGSLSVLQPKSFQVILGQALANYLGVGVGDTLTVVLPEAHVGLMGVLPRVKRVTVGGVFSVEYVYDNSLAFIHIEDAATLVHHKPVIDGIQVHLDNPFSAPAIGAAWRAQLPSGWTVQDWTVQNQSYFKVVQTEKTMMFLILMLLIAIATFNLISMLVMTVTEKEGDIAILRAMGATRGLIMRIFIGQGVLIGLAGVSLGGVLGYVLSHHVTEVVRWLEKIGHTRFLSKEFYFIDFLPSDFYWSDAISVLGLAFLMSVLATLYPAWRAASVWPAEVLRHE